MPGRSLLRDLVLLSAAALLGWFAHGANSAVHADTRSNDAAGLGFQFGGTGLNGTLTVYSPGSHMLYVYPTNSGSSRINCIYSLKVDRPGAPIERQNCGSGSLTGQ